MSLQSDAAKAHIEKLLHEAYPPYDIPNFGTPFVQWQAEYRFDVVRRWAFDYAVPAILCANSGPFLPYLHVLDLPRGEIEIDGGTFQNTRTGHSSGVGLRAWREKHNAAMAAGWRVWHYAPEEIIRAGRKNT